MGTINSSAEANARVFGQEVISIGAGQAANIDCRGFAKLRVVAGSGATVSVSRVDAMDAGAHGTGVDAEANVGAGTEALFDIDWPYFRVSTTGGAARVALS